jgi:hypothetical protein
MNVTAKQEDKLSVLLKEAEDSPILKTLRAEKAAEVLAKRREAAGRIAVLRNEHAAIIPKLQEALEATEAKYAAAKAALEGAAEEVRKAALALRTERLVSDNTYRNCEASLLQNYDPLIDETVIFFRDKMDDLRKPGRISTDRRGAERNIFTEIITTKVESNYDAINSALQYCRAAITTLEAWKLLPELDASKIEELKKGIPRNDVYAEITGEKPLPNVNADPFAGLPSDSEMKWSIGKLNEKFKKVMGRPF